jgi:hypothetical protein
MWLPLIGLLWGLVIGAILNRASLDRARVRSYCSVWSAHVYQSGHHLSPAAGQRTRMVARASRGLAMADTGL